MNSLIKFCPLQFTFKDNVSACYVVQYNIACLGKVGMFAVKLLEFYVGHFTNREKLEGKEGLQKPT